MKDFINFLLACETPEEPSDDGDVEEADLTDEVEQMREEDEQMSDEGPKVWRQTSNMLLLSLFC